MQSVFVMLFVGAIAFTLFQFVGDPINQMVGEDATQAEREELRERLGLNDPFYIQFARFIGNALQGEFGISYRLQQPVTELILSRLPATVELAFASALIAGLFTAPDLPGNWSLLSFAIVTVVSLVAWAVKSGTGWPGLTLMEGSSLGE